MRLGHKDKWAKGKKENTRDQCHKSPKSSKSVTRAQRAQRAGRDDICLLMH